jgi:hypothetical protein
MTLSLASSETSLIGTQTSSTITKELLRAVPSRTDIDLLLASVQKSPRMFYQFDYKSCCSTLDEAPTSSSAMPDLLQPETHPVLLARQMLLFAAELRCIPRKHFIYGLSKHQHDIMDELVESAIRNVTTNDILLGTLEGLELLVLEGFYHMDCGDARRAWATTRRAVMAAQLLGLHRPGHHRYRRVNDQTSLEPKAMWISIICLERVASLLLGLPTSTGGVVLAQGGKTSVMVIHLGDVAGRILERNQIEVPQHALELTKDIDRELIEIAEQMPPAFWRPSDFTGLARDSLEAFTEIRRALDHGRYYNLLIQLHLPHMLCPSHGSQRMYSKIACVNASREVLNRHIGLQSFEPAVSRCRMIDFPALIAGMTLMLAHVISHCAHAKENLFAHQRLSDRAMVERTLENLEFVSELHKETLIVKCTKLLTELLAIEQDAASEHKRRENQALGGIAERDRGRNMLIMRAPFLGGIKLSKEGVAALAASRADQDSNLEESTSIGGIGSIHVNGLRASRPDEINRTLSGPELQAAPSYHPNNEPNLAQTIPNDFIMNEDHFVLDNATSLEDWAFLGTDTAFFESLMRGVGDMPLDNANFES